MAETALAKLLHTAVDLIEGMPSEQMTPRELALSLDPSDFEGADPNVRIGLAYMQGRMQNLEDDLNAAREFANQQTEKLRTAESAKRTAEWKLSRAEAERDKLQAVMDALDNNEPGD